MDAQVFVDLARYTHIVAVAIGFGAAFLTDMHALRHLAAPIDKSFISSMHAYHTTIWYSVIAMWITGLVMIYIRTGFDLASFTPKLFAKLVTVSLLTINAQFIGAKVMPLIKLNRGHSLMSLPLKAKLRLAAIGAVSTASWMLALALGSSKILAVSGLITFVICMPIVYLGAIMMAVSVMYLLHLGAQMAPGQSGSLGPSFVAVQRPMPLILSRKAS